MKYICKIITSSTAIVKIIPENAGETLLFENLNPNNDFFENIILWYYGRGIKVENEKFVFLLVNSFLVEYTEAICTYCLKDSLEDFDEDLFS
jgi:hypothetical protein